MASVQRFADYLEDHGTHEMLSAGMQESDLMTLAGWRGREMLRRCAASAASDRALAAARRFNQGDAL